MEKRKQYSKIASVIGDNNTEDYLSDISTDYNKVAYCERLVKGAQNRPLNRFEKLLQGQKITLGVF